MLREALVPLEYQPYIDYAPMTPKQLHSEACSNDETTINSWRDIWLKNVEYNQKHYGPFSDRSIGKLFGYAEHKPCILIGSGPSLKINAHELKNKDKLTSLSCLHNFHFLEDIECPADFYVTLDAGDVTVEEVYEGGKKTPDEYWALTKNRKLIAFMGTSPKLLEKWQGEIYFFNAPIPDEELMKAFDSFEVFNTYVSNGGNVLGACLYIAKAYFGASVVAFIGADFSFSYDKKFHSWDSKYDKKLGYTIPARDVFGLPVKTWRSYHNFKGWFEYISLTVPGVYYNCTEGGTLGAYNEGNIRSIHQLPLKEFIRQCNIFKEIKEQAEDPKTKVKKLLF